MKYLNKQLSPQNWRVSWNRQEQWAIVPKEGNSLWRPLLARLPQKAARREAVEKRREALKLLASEINAIVRNCEKLPKRKRAYVSEPRANRLVGEILEIVAAAHYFVMDESTGQLPRAKAFYSENFVDKPA